MQVHNIIVTAQVEIYAPETRRDSVPHNFCFPARYIFYPLAVRSSRKILRPPAGIPSAPHPPIPSVCSPGPDSRSPGFCRRDPLTFCCKRSTSDYPWCEISDHSYAAKQHDLAGCCSRGVSDPSNFLDRSCSKPALDIFPSPDTLRCLRAPAHFQLTQTPSRKFHSSRPTLPPAPIAQ